MKRLFLLVVFFSLSAGAFAQQDYVGRYDFFTGFSYLDSPKLNLMQRGFNTQLGYNARRWLAFGFDYSIQTGHASLIAKDLKPQYETLLNQTLAAAQAGLIPGFPAALVPPGYVLWAPFDATTQTFTAGPQLQYRHFKKFTPFIHPSIGAIHENISIGDHGDPFIGKIVIPGLISQKVLKTTRPNDTTYFYGLGGAVRRPDLQLRQERNQIAKLFHGNRRLRLRTKPSSSPLAFALELFLHLPATLMPIAHLTLELRIEAAQSLKDRRQVLRSLKDRLRSGFNVSVAEVDPTDLWQTATLGVVAISSSRDYLDGLMKQVESAATRIANNHGAEITDSYLDFLD